MGTVYSGYNLYKARELAKQLNDEGEYELAGLLGLLTQTPIRFNDALLLKKTNIMNREIHQSCVKTGEEYRNMNGAYYKIDEKLETLLLSLHPGVEEVFTKTRNYYVTKIRKRSNRSFIFHELRHEQLLRERREWAKQYSKENI
ncbi:MAG: hypothetical protein PHN80_14505 [Hespellia sp.]|nr:hypothetical protein [Hespellia sp.]